MAGGGEPSHRLVEQPTADAVAVEVGIDVQRVDVPGARIRGAVVARADVGEPDDALVEPGDDHLAAVVSRAGVAATRRRSTARLIGGTVG